MAAAHHGFGNKTLLVATGALGDMGLKLLPLWPWAFRAP